MTNAFPTVLALSALFVWSQGLAQALDTFDSALGPVIDSDGSNSTGENLSGSAPEAIGGARTIFATTRTTAGSASSEVTGSEFVCMLPPISELRSTCAVQYDSNELVTGVDLTSMGPEVSFSVTGTSAVAADRIIVDLILTDTSLVQESLFAQPGSGMTTFSETVTFDLSDFNNVDVTDVRRIRLFVQNDGDSAMTVTIDTLESTPVELLNFAVE